MVRSRRSTIGSGRLSISSTCVALQISGHDDLKRYYGRAKVTKSIFVICFKTSNLKKIPSQESQGATVEWSTTGLWLGGDAFAGWDGGGLVSTPSQPGSKSLPPLIRLPSRSSVTSILRKGTDSGETVDPLLQRGKNTQFAGKRSERVFFADRMTLEQETLVATKMLQPAATTGAKTRAHTAKDRRDSDNFQNAARD
jgi:hypothetical protein